MTCAVSCCVCIASIVMTAPARLANAFSRSRTAGISLDFASTAACPRTAPMPCASAATRCGAFPSLSLRAADGLAVDRDHQPAAGLHGPGAQPGTENPVEHVGADQGERPPERGLLRRAAGRAQPGQHVRRRRRRPTARSRRTTSTPRSPPRSRRPAARPARCRRPRLFRGSGTWARRSSRYWLRAAGMGEDVIGGRASLVADDGERRNFHRSARAPPAARGHAGRITRCYDIAGHSLNS